MSYDRRRTRGDHPAACTCVDCDERRKWRLQRTSRNQRAPATPPSKPPATGEDIDQLRGNRSSRSTSPADKGGSRHHVWYQCPKCTDRQKPEEAARQQSAQLTPASAATPDLTPRSDVACPSGSVPHWTPSPPTTTDSAARTRGQRRPQAVKRGGMARWIFIAVTCVAVSLGTYAGVYLLTV